jgi:hypothetical protein
MILHASFTVDTPRDAAMTVAELMGGEAFPFPGLDERAWIAMSGDAFGTLVEFLPRGIEFHYVENKTVAHRHGAQTRQSGCHILVETPYDAARVLAIAEARSCLAHLANHGPIQVIEFWIEQSLLIEVVTQQLASAYKNLATLANVRAMAG